MKEEMREKIYKEVKKEKQNKANKELKKAFMETFGGTPILLFIFLSCSIVAQVISYYQIFIFHEFIFHDTINTTLLGKETVLVMHGFFSSTYTLLLLLIASICLKQWYESRSLI